MLKDSGNFLSFSYSFSLLVYWLGSVSALSALEICMLRAWSHWRCTSCARSKAESPEWGCDDKCFSALPTIGSHPTLLKSLNKSPSALALPQQSFERSMCPECRSRADVLRFSLWPLVLFFFQACEQNAWPLDVSALWYQWLLCIEHQDKIKHWPCSLFVGVDWCAETRAEVHRVLDLWISSRPVWLKLRPGQH